LSVKFLTLDTRNSMHNSIDNVNPPTKLIFSFYTSFFGNLSFGATTRLYDSSLKDMSMHSLSTGLFQSRRCQNTRCTTRIILAFSYGFSFGLEKWLLFFPSQGRTVCTYTNGSPIQYTWLDKRQDTSLGATDSRAKNAWRWWGFTI
jgi:hypothetical protein